MIRGQRCLSLGLRLVNKSVVKKGDTLISPFFILQIYKTK